MSNVENTPPNPTDLTECTQANVLAEAAATLAAEAAARAAAARTKAEEARARAEALRARATPPAGRQPELLDTTAPATEPTEAPAAQPDRRTIPDRRVSETDTRPDPNATERRSGRDRRKNSTLRDTDLTDNSGIIRLGDAVRAAVSAQSADRLANKPNAPATEPGALLEPIGHSAGLHTRRRSKRRIFSPGLFFLLALMTFFALYATGNLPQFDRLTNAAVHNTQSHNAEVVAAVAHHWRLMAGAAATLCLLLIILLTINNLRLRAHERD